MLTEHGTGLTRRLSRKAERAWGNFLRVRSDHRAGYWMRRYYRLARQFENQAVFPFKGQEKRKGWWSARAFDLTDERSSIQPGGREIPIRETKIPQKPNKPKPSRDPS